MTIEQAIKTAIAGGYGVNPFAKRIDVDDFRTAVTMLPYALLDHSFWQSLGKGLGWGGIGYNEDTGKKEWIDALRCPRDGEWLMGELCECPNQCDYDGSEIDMAGGNLYEWRYQWHRFIDHLAMGKDAASYFAELHHK